MDSILVSWRGTGKNLASDHFLPPRVSMLFKRGLKTDHSSVHGTSMLENNTHVTGGLLSLTQNRDPIADYRHRQQRPEQLPLRESSLDRPKGCSRFRRSF